MNATGRITKSLPRALQDIVYGRPTNAHLLETFCRVATLDECQAVLLLRAGLLDANDAKTLLKAIETEKAENFRNVMRRERPRGMYLGWEDWLTSATKDGLHGALHLGRSRNDMNATLQRLELRAAALELGSVEMRMLQSLLSRAKKETHVLLPAFTHYQPAVPVLASQLWLAWATALERDARLLLDAIEDLDVLPLGAAAVAGTRIQLDLDFAVRLLGFSSVCVNSIDSVASRTFLLKLLAACSILGVDLSRFATDILTLATREIPIITLPERFLGSSSHMPQKANPFLLELVQARAMSALQALVGAAVKMHATPYTNSFAVSSEARWGASDGLDQTLDSLKVLECVALSCVVDETAARRLCERGFTTATAIAEEITVQTGMPFRESHRLVGSLVRRTVMNPEQFPQLVSELALSHGVELNQGALTPSIVASTCNSAGGTGTLSVRKQITFLEARLSTLTSSLNSKRIQYASAERLLHKEVMHCINAQRDTTHH